jgi:hypothetical protein
MKTILILLFPIVFSNFIDLPKLTKSAKSEQHTIFIKDSNGEELCGVLNKYNNQYSNLKGKIIINKGDSINLTLISYETLHIDKIVSDTTIVLKEEKRCGEN